MFVDGSMFKVVPMGSILTTGGRFLLVGGSELEVVPKGSVVTAVGGISELVVFKGSVLTTAGGISELAVEGTFCVFEVSTAGGFKGVCVFSFD